VNQTLTVSTQIDHLELAGPPRTTHAGRLALPVALKDGRYTVATYELVLDENAATELHAAIHRHLAGQGAQPPAVHGAADLLR
jgi:hypothetical protein